MESELDVIMEAWEEKAIDGVIVKNMGAEIPDEEVREYIRIGRKKHTGITSADIRIDGDEVDIHYYTEPVHFERIRRITGYLVGTLDRFNNGKRAEVTDRVKHGL